jgi:hypothetical protein
MPPKPEKPTSKPKPAGAPPKLTPEQAAYRNLPPEFEGATPQPSPWVEKPEDTPVTVKPSQPIMGGASFHTGMYEKTGEFGEGAGYYGSGTYRGESTPVYGYTWTQLGYPQFEGKYESLKVPEGLYVKSVQMSGSTITGVTFGSLTEERLVKGESEKWIKAGFPEAAGKYNFPDLTTYGEGSYLGYGETGELMIFTPSKDKFVQKEDAGAFIGGGGVPTLASSVTQRQIVGIKEMFNPLKDYYAQYSAKETEFNALPLELKINELKRLKPEYLPTLTSGQVITDVKFEGGELKYSFGVTVGAVKAKREEFAQLSLEQRISELQRLSPESLPQISSGLEISDVQFTGEGLQYSFKISPSAYAAKEAEFAALSTEQQISELKRLMPEALPTLKKGQTITNVSYVDGKLSFAIAETPLDFEALPEQAQLLQQLNVGGDPVVKAVGDFFKSVGLDFSGVGESFGLTGLRSEQELGVYEGKLMTRGEYMLKTDPFGYAIKSVAQDVSLLTLGMGGLTLKGITKLGTAGAGLDVGVSQTLKFVKGEGWMSAPEFIESAAQGAIFNVGFAGAAKTASYIYKASGLATSRLAMHMAMNVRPAVNQPFRNIARQISETKIYRGMTSEVLPLTKEYNPIFRAEQYLTGKITSSYSEAVKAGTVWRPTLSERLLIRATGIKPSTSATGFVSVPRAGGQLRSSTRETLDLRTPLYDATDTRMFLRETGYLKTEAPKPLAFKPKPTEQLPDEFIDVEATKEFLGTTGILKKSSVVKPASFSEAEIASKTESLGSTYHYKKELGRLPTRSEVLTVLEKEASEKLERETFLSAFTPLKASTPEEVTYLASVRAKAPINKPLLPERKILEAQDLAWDLAYTPRGSALLVGDPIRKSESFLKNSLIKFSGAGSGTKLVFSLPEKLEESAMLIKKPITEAPPVKLSLEEVPKTETTMGKAETPTVTYENVQPTRTEQVPNVYSKVAPFPGSRQDTYYEEEIIQAVYPAISPIQTSTVTPTSDIKNFYYQEPKITPTQTSSLKDKEKLRAITMPIQTKIIIPSIGQIQYNIPAQIQLPIQKPVDIPIQTPLTKPMQTPINIVVPTQIDYTVQEQGQETGVRLGFKTAQLSKLKYQEYFIIPKKIWYEPPSYLPKKDKKQKRIGLKGSKIGKTIKIYPIVTPKQFLAMKVNKRKGRSLI